MENVIRRLFKWAAAGAAALALLCACPVFAEDTAAQNTAQTAAQLQERFRIEQAYVNAPDARVYFYALQDDGSSYQADVVGLAGLQLQLGSTSLDVGAVSAAGSEATTYICVLDTTMGQEEYDQSRRAVYKLARQMQTNDQLIVYLTGSQPRIVAGLNTSYTQLRSELNGAQLSTNTTGAIADAITAASGFVDENFALLNPRKVLFLFTRDSSIVGDEALMVTLKQTDQLGALGFSIYGFSYYTESTLILNMLQWMCGYDSSLLTAVNTDTIADAFDQRCTELQKALVATTTIDKGQIDSTTKTLSLSVPSLNVQAETLVLLSHELASPAVRTVDVVDRNTVQVRFNEAVNGAGSTKAYLLKDDLGRRIELTGVTVDADESGALLRVKNLYDGNYTLALRSGRISDKSSSANLCSTDSVSFTFEGGYGKDLAYFWELLHTEIYLVLAVAAVYLLLLWNEKRRDRRTETVAQAEAYLSGEESAVLAGNDPADGDPRAAEVSLPPHQLRCLPALLMIQIDRLTTHRMEMVVVNSCLIGSAPGQCDLRIDDERVDGQHCILSVEPDGLYAQDLDSRYGTFINGKRIAELTRLESGAQLKIGKTTIKVRYKNEQPQLRGEEKNETDQM